MENNVIEILWIKLKSTTNIAIAAVYGKQETTTRDAIEAQFEELTTQANQLQQDNHIVIMGDLNAKVAVTKGSCNQTASRNGTLLTEFIKQTETTVINTMEKHQGTWTRQNRKNSNEKSIIDYIITSNHLAAKVLESTTEDGTTNLIRGNNPTDHNIITATLDIAVKRERKTTKQWKRGQPKDWENFNQALATDWRNLNANKQDYQNLQKIIIKNLENKIG